MKKIGISQRVSEVEAYQERRDCLDQRWFNFIDELGYLLVALPNLASDKTAVYLQQLQLDGIILSGGNSLSHLQPHGLDVAPERDRFESALLQQAMQTNTAVLGICRGMQLINCELGGKLIKLAGHSNVRHAIKPCNNSVALTEEVNSFHHWGIAASDLAETLEPLATDIDGHIEAFQNSKQRLLGLMWHPERELPFNPLDLSLIETFFS